MQTRVPVWVWFLASWCVLFSALGPAYAQSPPSEAGHASPDEAPSPAQADSFALGVAVPLSGDYAPVGKQVLEAARIAAKEAGVRVSAQDTEGTPVGAIAAVGQLAKDDSVLAVIGPVGRRESSAAARVAQRAGLPLFSLASSDAVNRAGNWVYRLRLTPAEQAAQLAEAVREDLPEHRRAGIFFPDSDYGREAAVSFAERFRARGGQLGAVASYPEDTSDFRKAVDELVGARVHIGRGGRMAGRRADADGYVALDRKAAVDFDVLFIPDFHGRVARMLSFFPRAGIQTGAGGEGRAVQMLGLSGWQGSSMELTGAHAAGAIYADLYAGAADGGRAEDFALMFEGETGRRPVDLDAEVFDAAWVVSRLVKKAAKRHDAAEHAPEPPKLRLFVANELPRDDGITGVSGELRFGGHGEPLKQIRLYQFDVDGVIGPWK